MADFSALIQRIKDAVYENGVQAITGQILQDCLKDVVNTVNVAKQDGIYRVTVTVDNNTGVPSATARMDDDTYTLEFTFHNLKGEKGDKGDKGDTPVLTADSDGVIYSDGAMLTRVIKDTTDALTTRADSDHARAESDHARAETDHTDTTRARLDAETAAGEANYASLRANTAADNADAAREAIQSDLAQKQDVIPDLQQIRAGATDTVKYSTQSLTDAQKTQARTNIAAASDAEVSQLRSEKIDTKYGKNIFKPDPSLVGKFLSSTGGIYNNATYGISSYMPIEGGADYYVATSGNGTIASNNTYFCWYDSSFGFISSVAGNNKSLTAPSNASYLRVTYNVLYSEIQVEKGTTKTAFEPTSPLLGYPEFYDVVQKSSYIGPLRAMVDPSGYEFISKTTNAYSNVSLPFPIPKGAILKNTGPGLVLTAKDSSLTNRHDIAVGATWVTTDVVGIIRPTYNGYVELNIQLPYRQQELADASVTVPKLASDVIALLEGTPSVKFESWRTSGTLAAGESLTTASENIPKNTLISAQIIGSIESIEVGIDDTSYGKKITITPSDVIVSGGSTYTHGLVLGSITYVYIDKANGGEATIRIINDSGDTFSQSVSWGVIIGDPFIKNGNSSSSIDASLSFMAKDITKKIWLFGDSYTNIYDSKRWPKYLKDWGYISYLLNAKPGLGAGGGYSDFQNLLSRGFRPSFAVWCYGMNGGADQSGAVNPTWLSTTQNFLTVCEANSITPILATIPSVPSQIHTELNAWVRSSGYRYIDFAKAVEADSGYYWRGWETAKALLYSDEVHPSEYGAIELASQVLIDFPEITE